MTPEQESEAISMVRMGMVPAVVARFYGVSRQYFSGLLRARRVKVPRGAKDALERKLCIIVQRRLRAGRRKSD